jgi:hypothetical protein
MYDRIEADLKGVQQAPYSSHTVSIVASSSEVLELGDEATQLQRIVDATEAHLRQVHEEKEKAT